MATVKILRSQRAEIGRLLTTEGLSPRDFEWREVKALFAEKTLVPSLVQKGTEFYFTFDIYKRAGKDQWVCPHSPDKNKPKANTLVDNWDGAMREFATWSKLVKRELEAEDPWDEAAEEFNTDWTTSEEKFTPQEIEKIDHRLDEVKQYLIDQSDKTEASTAAIEAGIEDLKKSARLFSKKDWALMFAGWFFSQCANWAIGQEHWQQVVSLLLKGTKTFLLQAL